jgi:hypothetical protein
MHRAPRLPASAVEAALGLAHSAPVAATELFIDIGSPIGSQARPAALGLAVDDLALLGAAALPAAQTAEEADDLRAAVDCGESGDFEPRVLDDDELRLDEEPPFPSLAEVAPAVEELHPDLEPDVQQEAAAGANSMRALSAGFRQLVVGLDGARWFDLICLFDLFASHAGAFFLGLDVEAAMAHVIPSECVAGKQQGWSSRAGAAGLEGVATLLGARPRATYTSNALTGQVCTTRCRHHSQRPGWLQGPSLPAASCVRWKTGHDWRGACCPA